MTHIPLKPILNSPGILNTTYIILMFQFHFLNFCLLKHKGKKVFLSLKLSQGRVEFVEAGLFGCRAGLYMTGVWCTCACT